MPKLDRDYPVPISIRVSIELAEQIQNAAAREDRTISAWVRRQLRRVVLEDQTTKEKQPAALSAKVAADS